MFSAVIKLALAPRLWLSAGVFCLGVSIVMGYHQDQMVAKNTLAQKIVIPTRTIVQDFTNYLHENTLGEVHILAEAALDRAVRVDVGSRDSERLVDIVPIYPVSRQSFPIVRSLAGTARRPVLRADADKLAKHDSLLARVENVPVGLMVFEAGESKDLAVVDQLSLGMGVNGPLVEVIGVRIGANAILTQAAGPLAENGVRLIRDSLVITPYLYGRGGKAIIQDLSAVQHVLFWASAFMISFGLASMFSLLPSFEKVEKVEDIHDVKAVGAFPGVNPFQPIAGQDELVEGYRQNAVRKISRMMTTASAPYRTKSRQ